MTNDTGTGIVHTAPSHGMDDFTICVYHNIISLPGQTQSPLQTTIPQVSLPSSIPRYQVTEDVDENGCYFKTSWVPRLQGKPVLKEGNQEEAHRQRNNTYGQRARIRYWLSHKAEA